ncbi:hypothetical protein [Candidatus Nitrotoga sp. 1052]|uniref:hypothetical protein n=1 Tax=Candidatus Nitrotoga sp. 1052 TaxID=2886964 RepID=UPI001EF66A1B|nr:hypothetical protein [Candidatus Nitrotoga sp. 1052]CAH1078823.1 hypothetical protein NTG1052_330022 [Candidatus Nitrotoga sp. 1052]
MNLSSKYKQISSKWLWISLSIGGLLLIIYFRGMSASNEGALIRELRLVSKQNSSAYQENLDAVVLKHIPLGTPANVALKMCQQNGFRTTRSKDMKGATYPGFEEHIFCTQKEVRWFLVFTEEYRVILYIKNNQVGAAIGRFFVHSI